MISAKVIADSKNKFGNRITTMVVTLPRFILAELNTHRMFSRNSASSRAIPFEKMLKSVEENPFIPIAWQKDHKGMQGTKYLNEKDSTLCKNAWLEGRDWAVNQAKMLSNFECTKQLCNRLLEPFMWHTVIVTATEWENFFALRCPQYQIPHTNFTEYKRSWKDVIKYAKENYIQEYQDNIINASLLAKLSQNKGQAEIHMMALAEAMWDAMNESTPKELKAGEWHIPFGDDIRDTESTCYETFFSPNAIIEMKKGGTYGEALDKIKIKIATARCARVSYTVVGEEGKEPNYENDIKLHDRLADSGHWSPFEHCAQTMSPQDKNEHESLWDASSFSGNFQGFIQYRKTFKNENRN